jgi:ATP-dependent DNA helicase RecQ
MAELRPTTRHALARVSGVGEAKLDRYGDAFIELLQGWAEA